MWGAVYEMYTRSVARLPAAAYPPAPRATGIYCFPVRLSPVVGMHVEVTEQFHSIWKPGGG